MPPITPAPTDIPDEEAENVSAATVENIIPSHSDSDSDIEIDHNGYELLSQDPEIFFSAQNDEEDYNSDVEESMKYEDNNLNTSLLHIPATVCQSNECNSELQSMSEAHIETIKSVMKGITLPSSNLPQWATLVPEEEWKAALFSEMHARQSKTICSNREMHLQPFANKNKLEMSTEALR